jgi:SAM-dependent methyltransferase
MISKALRTFLYPASPAAVYRHPGRFLNFLRASCLNRGLRIGERIKPGGRVACNICGWRGRRFGYAAAVSVDFFEPDNLCLRCASNPRTRSLIDLLVSQVGLDGNLTVADVGAAACTRFFFRRYPDVRYLVVDRYKEADVFSDIVDIRLPADSVDRILCCHVLEHIDDYRKGIAELFRILRSGGSGIIAVPQTPGLARSERTHENTFQGYGHVWEFGDDFPGRLTDAGFRVRTVVVPAEDPKKKSEPIPYHLVVKP